MMILLVAFIFGVGIPGSVIWGKENLNTKIRGKSDLEVLSVPLLGVIAEADNEEQNAGVSLLVSETGRDMLNESFRMVRTSTDAICGKDKKVIMFTSFEPGCGKTFIALNLAMSFALTGKKIALVDVDMRTATLSKVIDTQEASQDLGYCAFLNKTVTYRQLLLFNIQKNRYYKDFDIFPVGMIPPNPTELLMGERFGVMLESLKKKYDYVFLDCTPLDIVTDATIVSRYADLTVFIVRENYTDRRKLRELENIYKQQVFNNMNLILNGSKLSISFTKYHTRYHKKVDKVAKQIRAHDRMIAMPREEKKTKMLTEGSKEPQNNT
jgi:capsular exopolysaccharide synthesis family protein